MKNRVLLLILIMSLAAGCGESFRPVMFSGQEAQSQDTFFNEQGRRVSTLEMSLDQRVFLDFQNDMIGREAALEEIHSRLEAVDVVVRSAGENLVQIRARVSFGCEVGAQFIREVPSGLMRSAAMINLGTLGEYRVQTQCTTSQCGEMVAAVQKVEGSFQGTLLVPLAVMNGNPGSNEILYGQRELNVEPYFSNFRYDTVAEFEQAQSCMYSEYDSDFMATDDRSFLETFIDDGVGGVVNQGVNRVIENVADRNENVQRGLDILERLGIDVQINL